jgi:hypothetical protein
MDEESFYVNNERLQNIRHQRDQTAGSEMDRASSTNGK